MGRRKERVPDAVLNQRNEAREKFYPKSDDENTDADSIAPDSDTDTIKADEEKTETPKTPDRKVEPEAKPKNHEAAYKALQGKYNAEMPRLRKDLSEVKDALDKALEQNKQLQSALSQQTQEPPQQATPTDKDISDLMTGVKEMYGDDDPVTAMLEDISKQNKAYQEEIDRLKRQVSGVANQNVEQRLDALKINVQEHLRDTYNIQDVSVEVDSSEEFAKYMQELDPAARSMGEVKTRQEVFNDAVARLDEGVVRSYYDSYLSARKGGAPERRKKLDAHVTPTTLAEGEQNPDKGTVSQAKMDEMNQKYMKSSDPKVMKKHDDSRRAYFEAAKEGRVA